MKQPNQAAFLAAFRHSANITRAAEAAGIDRHTHYRWLAEDPEYAEAFEVAKVQAAGMLEDIAVQRATEGLDEPLIYHGEICYEPVKDAAGNYVFVPAIDGNGDPILDERGFPRMEKAMQPLMIRKRSDALLQQLLKAWLPRKYRENHHVETTETRSGLSALTDAELDRIARRGSAGAAAPANEPEQNPDLLPG